MRPSVRLAVYACVVLGSLLWAAPALAFVDVTPDSPYADAINDLADRGIISGVDADHFQPEQSVTRQQFAKMIDLALQVEVTDADICPFADVDPSVSPQLYPDHYVAVAAEHGFARGYSDGSFRPTSSITRAQAVTMVVRALDAEYPDALMEPEPGDTGPWGDFDPEHGPNALKAAVNGLLDPRMLYGVDPWQPMSRGEVAQVLDQVAWFVDFMLMPQPETVDCLAVVDGETVRVLRNGVEETVRLLGVDAPALSEPFGIQARDFLAFLVLGRSLDIFFDVQERDDEGNLLAYLSSSSMDFGGLANVEMLRMGLARLSDDPIDPENHDMFAGAQAAAQASHLGIWADLAP